jgi:TolA-binding protein
LVLSIGGPPASVGQEAPFVIDPAKRRAITQDVLSSQRDPRGRTQKLEALQAYERFVMEDLAGRSTLRAEAMHNLGDLYAEIETAATERAVRGKSGGKPSSRTKSIAVYERLLISYPRRPENDGALYQLARAYSETGRGDEAAARLNRLLVDFPKSPYAPEAAFRLGLRAFAARDFSKAAELFAAASQGQDPTLVEAGRYHTGWTALNLQEYTAAAAAFAAILDTATTKGRTSGGGFSLSDYPEAEAAFLTDVMHALLLAFDYLGGPEEMRAYWGAGGRRPYEETLYRTLGALYQEQDRTADAVAAYNAFLAAAPLHPAAPRFEAAIADAYTRAKWQGPLIQSRERLADRYGPGSAWARANPDLATQVAFPQVKDALYQLALYEHTQAQKARKPASWEKALTRDDRFLAWFPKEVESARVAWLRGEALFELGRYTEAADAYRHSAYDYPLHAQTREAAYAAVTATEHLIPSHGVVSPEAAEQLAARSSQFVAAFPDDARGADVLMNAAKTAERAGRPALADTLAGQLVDRYPSSRWGAPAQRIIGQARYDQGRFAEAEQAFRRASKSASSKEAAAVNALAASAVYQRATRDQQEGRLSEAVAEFMRVASDYPTTPLAPGALAQAARIHEASGRSPEALAAWKQVAEAYPESAEAPTAWQRLAVSAEQSGDLAGAIAWYDRLSARSDAATRDQLSWTVAALAERAPDWPRAERTLGALAGRTDLPPDQTVEAGFRASRAALQQGRAGASASLSEATLARYRTWRSQTQGRDLTQADVLAARTLVDLGDRRAAACAAIRLREPLERTLAEKRSALNAALEAYAEAVDIRAPDTTAAATHKIGAALDEFFQAVLASERPTGLTDEQLDQYNFLLEEQAAPFEEQAVSAYETNVRRTRELGVYDDWIAQSFQRLAALRPARYLRPEAPELARRHVERTP